MLLFSAQQLDLLIRTDSKTHARTRPPH